MDGLKFDYTTFFTPEMMDFYKSFHENKKRREEIIVTRTQPQKPIRFPFNLQNIEIAEIEIPTK